MCVFLLFDMRIHLLLSNTVFLKMEAGKSVRLFQKRYLFEVLFWGIYVRRYPQALVLPHWIDLVEQVFKHIINRNEIK